MDYCAVGAEAVSFLTRGETVCVVAVTDRAELVSAAFELVPDGLLIFDDTGRWIEANREAYRLLAGAGRTLSTSDASTVATRAMSESSSSPYAVRMVAAGSLPKREKPPIPSGERSTPRRSPSAR